jgi:hypothetical protein
MPSTIDFTGLTLNPEEARSLSECIQEQVYSKPQLTRVHEVATGVEQDKYIPILGKYGLVGKADPGSCGNNDITATIPTSQKMWEPKLISGKLAHCQSDIPNLLKFWKKSRIAAKTWEEVDNEMMAFINDRAVDAILESIFRHSEFGDKNAKLVANGGYLTAGLDKAFFNVINGMWAQVFADDAGSRKAYRYTIDENTKGTDEEQYELAETAALLIFRNLYKNADSRIFEGNAPVFQVTKSIFDNWQDFMENKSGAFTLDRIEKGSTTWNYRGIPIVVRADWDRNIKAFHNLGDSYYLPNRAILTDIANIPIGTSDSESLTSLNSWYSQDDEKHYIKFAYKLDQKNLQEELMAVAF